MNTTTCRIALSVMVSAAPSIGSANAANKEVSTAELQQQIDNLEDKLEAMAEFVERPAVAQEDRGKTTLGGYGELHYNNLDSKKEIDFHRFVLFFGHRFNDQIRFSSEVELEHSNTESGGAIELEQAYLDFQLSDRHAARAGLFLIPVGILNETHEPPTFYGVERNPVETHIIPTTWWEAGAGLLGELAPGLRYDLAFTSGLQVETTGANAYDLREGRKNVSRAPADNAAYTGRIKWTGLPGVEIAATLQRQQDITQGTAGVPAVSAILAETHAVVSRGPFTVKVLYTQWRLDGDGPKALGRDDQKGWYLEPSYKIKPKLGVFARYNTWDSEAGDSVDSKKKQTDVGVNYWPHENVVLKADIMDQSGAVSDKGFNLGLGYQF